MCSPCEGKVGGGSWWVGEGTQQCLTPSLPPFQPSPSPNILLGLCLCRINHIIWPFVSGRLSAIDFVTAPLHLQPSSSVGRAGSRCRPSSLSRVMAGLGAGPRVIAVKVKLDLQLLVKDVGERWPLGKRWHHPDLHRCLCWCLFLAGSHSDWNISNWFHGFIQDDLNLFLMYCGSTKVTFTENKQRTYRCEIK